MSNYLTPFGGINSDEPFQSCSVIIEDIYSMYPKLEGGILVVRGSNANEYVGDHMITSYFNSSILPDSILEQIIQRGNEVYLVLTFDGYAISYSEAVYSSERICKGMGNVALANYDDFLGLDDTI